MVEKDVSDLSKTFSVCVESSKWTRIAHTNLYDFVLLNSDDNPWDSGSFHVVDWLLPAKRSSCCQHELFGAYPSGPISSELLQVSFQPFDGSLLTNEKHFCYALFGFRHSVFSLVRLRATSELLHIRMPQWLTPPSRG
jgi:hypothetical protein